MVLKLDNVTLFELIGAGQVKKLTLEVGATNSNGNEKVTFKPITVGHVTHVLSLDVDVKLPVDTITINSKNGGRCTGGSGGQGGASNQIYSSPPFFAMVPKSLDLGCVLPPSTDGVRGAKHVSNPRRKSLNRLCFFLLHIDFFRHHY